MFAVVISEKGGAERREVFDRPEISVGRVQGNDLMLPKGNVSKRHARLLHRDNRFIVTDLNSTNGTYVNRRRISQATIVREGDRVYIGDFVLRIELPSEVDAANAAEARPAEPAEPADASDPVPAPGPAAPVPPPPPGPPRPPAATAHLEAVDPSAQARHSPAPATHSPAPPSPPDVPPPATPSQLPESASDGQRAIPSPEAASTGERMSSSGVRELRLEPDVQAHRSALVALVSRVEEQLGDALNQQVDESVRARIDEALVTQLATLQQQGQLAGSVNTERLREDASLELGGLGPVGLLLNDDDVSEIAVPDPYNVIAERRGERALVEPPFSTPQAMWRVVNRLALLSGTPIGQGEMVLQRRLPGGARLNAVLDYGIRTGPMLVIHKPQRLATTSDDLVRRGSVSRAMATFLAHCVSAGASVLVVGDRDAKTADVVNAVAGQTSGQLVVVEGDDELMTGDPRVTRVRLDPNLGDSEDILDTLARLPDSWLVAERLEGSLAGSVLGAASGGMDGLIAGLRASTLERGVLRLVQDLMRSGVDRETALVVLASSFQVLVEVSRLRDGRQRVMRVAEIRGVAGSELQLEDIFTFHIERTAVGGSVEGTFVPSGVVPRLAQQLLVRGINVETTIFSRPPSR